MPRVRLEGQFAQGAAAKVVRGAKLRNLHKRRGMARGGYRRQSRDARCSACTTIANGRIECETAPGLEEGIDALGTGVGGARGDHVVGTDKATTARRDHAFPGQL